MEKVMAVMTYEGSGLAVHGADASMFMKAGLTYFDTAYVYECMPEAD